MLIKFAFVTMNALRKNQKNQLNNTGINQQKLRAFAGELAKDIHTQDDLEKTHKPQLV
jgi:hypothetical protein